MNATYEVAVRQYLMPDGRVSDQLTDLPTGTEAEYCAMIEHGCHFESEMLSNGMISLSISDGAQDIAIEIVRNGPEVQRALESMLRAKPWLRAKEVET